MPPLDAILTGGALALAVLLSGAGVSPRRWLAAGCVGIAGGLLVTGLAPMWSAAAAGFRAAPFEVPAANRDQGYVSSDHCRACHPGEYDSWHGSFHRTMTQLATADAVVGDFGDGQPVHLSWRGVEVVLSRRGDYFIANVPSTPWELSQEPSIDRREKRVVMTTGSHHQQVYWTTGEFAGDLRALPFQWLIDEERWVPREAAFVAPPGHFEGKFWRWNDICIQCHATAGRTSVDRTSFVMKTTTGELGIACEACHGPAAEHVAAQRDPLERYRGHLNEGRDAHMVQPERLDDPASAQVCGSCHSVSMFHDPAWLANGQSFRPGEDLQSSKRLLRPAVNEADRVVDGRSSLDSFWSDGMVRVSGREYNGLIESRCFEGGELSCVSCHSMHDGESTDDQLTRELNSDESCLQCHEGIAARTPEHTHHAVGSTGAACVACHMPHTTYGLLKGIRSHLIDSPRVADTLATGRPIACNQCHLDRTMAWTATYLNEWYGQEVPELTAAQREVSASILWLLEGDAGVRALTAYTMGREEALAASGRDWVPVYLALLFEDPYVAVRLVAERALRRHEGYENVRVALVEDPLARTAARRDLQRAWSAAGGAGASARPELLYTEGGQIDMQAVEEHRKRRDDTPLFLAE